MKNILKVDGRTLELSNLEKVLYPAAAFTKAEVIDYYIRISPVLLPHLKNRPLTMVRFPDGVEGEHFYEKNAPSYTPKWVKTAVVKTSSEHKSIRHILINDLPTLIWSANLANLELHTVLGRVPHPERPTMVVFDLDPGAPAEILECAEVALWLKEVFDILKLESFPKSSGSKGIQVYVPLNTPADFESTREFARTIATLLEQQHRDKIVTSMSKQLRKGKVFIDWSQNASFKTTVSVYSLRAKKERPYVSVPLTWQELEDALKKSDPTGLYFEPGQVLRRVEKFGDLFEPLLKLKQKLPRALPKEKVASAAAKVRKPAPGDRSLRAYRAKRDFQKTKEPAPGLIQKSGGKGRMFVIQKHAARRLHYDFRLEMEGVLRSWAIPKGVPTEPGDRRLAVHVEDHPMEYARFEGTIPAGQYGGGTVMVWDIGTYTVEDGDPVRAYRKGKLSLQMKGKKIKGEWVLVKTRGKEGDKESWLLLKKGEPVRPISLRQDDRSVLTGRSMKRIATDNDAQWISNRPSS